MKYSTTWQKPICLVCGWVPFTLQKYFAVLWFYKEYIYIYVYISAKSVVGSARKCGCPLRSLGVSSTVIIYVNTSYWVWFCRWYWQFWRECPIPALPPRRICVNIPWRNVECGTQYTYLIVKLWIQTGYPNEEQSYQVVDYEVRFSYPHKSSVRNKLINIHFVFEA